MIIYLLKSIICLAVLLAFYYLVLKGEKMHQFNRLYLLGSAFFSLFAPLYTFYVEVRQDITEVADVPIEYKLDEVIILPSVVEVINYKFYFIGFSLLVSTILLIRFGRNLLSILQKIRKNEHQHYKNATVILVDDCITPHSFWNYIFLSKSAYRQNQIESEIFAHELAHVTQRHSIDIILIEILQVIFWFNPFYFSLKKSVQLNHEFIADNHVVTSHDNITKYQYLLLNKTDSKNQYSLASNLNYSLTKKRLLMMTASSSPTSILFKKLLVIPFLVGAIFLFGDRVEAQGIIEKSNTKSAISAIQTESNGIRLPEYKADRFITIDNVKYFFSHKNRDYTIEDGVIIELDIVNEYKAMNATYEKLKNQGKHYIYKVQEEKIELERMFSDLGGMYFRMTSKDRSQVKRPNRYLTPYHSFVNQNGEIYYKKESDFTDEEKSLIPPPPPPLPSADKNG